MFKPNENNFKFKVEDKVSYSGNPYKVIGRALKAAKPEYKLRSLNQHG